MILVDTNVLARSIESAHPQQQAAVAAMQHVRVQMNEEIAITPQVLMELYAICTRSVNGLGFTPDRAMMEISAIKTTCPICADSPGVFTRWEDLVARYKPRNREVFDTRLVAVMVVYGIRQLLTFNDRHFRQFTEIQSLNPFDLLGIPRL